jgi:PAS domain-containing protein
MTAATLEQGAPIETVSYAVFGIALDGTVQSWSSGAERLYGIRSDEIVGKPHTLLEKSGISVDLSSLRKRT